MAEGRRRVLLERLKAVLQPIDEPLFQVGPDPEARVVFPLLCELGDLGGSLGAASSRSKRNGRRWRLRRNGPTILFPGWSSLSAQFFQVDRFTITAIAEAVEEFLVDVVVDRVDRAVAEDRVHAAGMRGAETEAKKADFITCLVEFYVVLCDSHVRTDRESS